MVEHGAAIKSQLCHVPFKLLLCNFSAPPVQLLFEVKWSFIGLHSKDRETPFAVYIEISVFAKTRKRQLIDMLYDNGFSNCYDKVLKLLAQLRGAVISQYVEDAVVCPPALRYELFTLQQATILNITRQKQQLNDTSITLFQHPSLEYPGEERELLKPKQH